MKYIVHYTKYVVFVKNLTEIIAQLINEIFNFGKTFSMLQFKVKEVMLAAGIPNPYTWLIKYGKFSQPKATGLLKQSAKTITLKDISKLCMLLNCTPNDLLYWAADKRQLISETHPCNTQLTPPNPDANWEQLLVQIPKSDVLDIHAKVVAMVQEVKAQKKGSQ